MYHGSLSEYPSLITPCTHIGLSPVPVLLNSGYVLHRFLSFAILFMCRCVVAHDLACIPLVEYRTFVPSMTSLPGRGLTINHGNKTYLM